jgi:hypothetical protein
MSIMGTLLKNRRAAEPGSRGTSPAVTEPAGGALAPATAPAGVRPLRSTMGRGPRPGACPRPADRHL